MLGNANFIQYGAHPFDDLSKRFPSIWNITGGVGPRYRVHAGVLLDDLRPCQALPCAEGNLTQTGFALDVFKAIAHNRLCGFECAREIAAYNPVKVCFVEPQREGTRLRAPLFAQRNIGVPLEAAVAIPSRPPMTDDVEIL
ncbi:MAG: hypothetical protein M3N19_03810 [Candidatus Eremiobacteraeota bacterium]|nr:hypothetical protein [Candidatus Eremiobacteraeota bacterium]